MENGSGTALRDIADGLGIITPRQRSQSQHDDVAGRILEDVRKLPTPTTNDKLTLPDTPDIAIWFTPNGITWRTRTAAGLAPDLEQGLQAIISTGLDEPARHTLRKHRGADQVIDGIIRHARAGGDVEPEARP